ncbi:hypothetical protein ABL78_7506 [Leptomonas seymouri]|uniref:Uncharacterized protein n=1 Tax=Leptomonas seymouri TaxID=5684 RepID=A0A0N1I0I3_LEPSE|nr:hypothetical protein ABL78_7506 [Leptomonas seymouri]|eukprot:KPI83460.1 hypothetical protein ABL78_7506 [Leptomonas seymouri]
MRGHRVPRCLAPPFSATTPLPAPHAPALWQERGLDHLRRHQAYAPIRLGVNGTALAPPLHTFVRCYASTRETATAPPIRSTQGLHTTLLGFAHASAAAAVAHHSIEKDDKSCERSVEATHRDGFTCPSTEVRIDKEPLSAAHSLFPLHAADTERRLLQRLLLHRRSSRRRSREEGAAEPHRPPNSPSSALRAMRASSGIDEQTGVVVEPSLSGHASWARAFELFSEAVHQHHVPPTAQHFNLLLYIAQQHRLWSRMDAVEELQAHLLASVQQLISEKEERRGGVETSAGGKYVMKPTQANSASTSLTASPSASHFSNQITELQEMEAALMPNAQTYELLLAAALARGSWSRAIEYCEMRTRSGAAVLTDSSLRQALQVYALAGMTAAGDASVDPPAQISPTPPRRLGTDQQRTGLRAAAAAATAGPPRSTATTTSSIRSRSSATPPKQYWSVALDFFRGNLHRVTSMQTVWSMVALLSRVKQQTAVLQIVNEDCRELVQAHLFALASHALSDSRERAALLQALRATSEAAREVGDWMVAQQLLRDVVELRRQLTYARSSSVRMLWGAPSPSLSSTRLDDASLSILAADSRVTGAELYENNDGDDTRMETELQLSQFVLQSTLHTLRRVRRYADVVELYRSSPHHALSGGGVVPVGMAEAEAGELAIVWRTMWTPQAIAFVAQAGLATGDLDLLLGLCGMADSSRAAALPSGPPASAPLTQLDIPADAYDAALRLLQSRILQHHLRLQAAPSEVKAAVQAHGEAPNDDEVQHYVALSQRVYAAYRQRVLESVYEETAPYHQYLQRVSKQLASNDDDTLTPSAQQQEQAHRKRSFTQACALLSATHAPLAQLLAQSLQPDTTEAALRSMQQQALAHFKRIRRPDTLSIALAIDFLLSQTRFTGVSNSSSKQPARHLTDAEAQSIVLAVQQIFDAVLEKERLGSVQLIAETNPPSSPCSQPNQPLDSASSQHLTALSVVTSAAVLMSFDVLARTQPLTLLRFIPRTVQLGWLPRGLAAEQLQVAQRAVMERAAPRLQITTPPLKPSRPTAKTSLKAPASSGAAVANFAQLYSQSTMAAVSPAQQVLAAAALVLTELQRTGVGHPPTAAMAAFKRTLQDVWKGGAAARRVSRAPSAVIESSTQQAARDAELEVAVVGSVNALVQQVGASTVSRWTMWGDCADILGGYLSSPLASNALCEEEGTRESYRPATQQTEGDTREAVSHAVAPTVAPNRETLHVLRTFLRLCDKAEAPFVEYVTMRWILGCGGETTALGEADGTTETRAPLPGNNPRRVALAMRRLCEISSQTSFQPLDASSHTSAPGPRSVAPSSLSDLHMEAMLLLLDALSWACRRHDRTFARQLYTSLAPWIDTLIAFKTPPSDNAATLSQQLGHLRDAAQSSYMTLLQCFSNGSRRDVLRDWPVQQHVLRQLILSGSQQLATEATPTSLTRLRGTAVLVDGVAAVVVKLQRTLHFLLTQLALDTHRALARAQDGSRTAGCEPPCAPIAPQQRIAVETAAEAFSEFCTAQLLSSLVLPCLRVCAGSAFAVQGEGSQQVAPISASLLASLEVTAEAVWAVDFAAFVWHTRFRPALLENEGGADHTESTTRALARFRQRGYQLFTSQLRWTGTENSLTRPLRRWLLFTAHSLTAAAAVSIPPSRAVAELCRDLTTLEVLYTVRTPAVFRVTSAAAERLPAAHLPLQFFIEQVDELSTTRLACAASTPASSASSTDCSARASASAALPRLRDGSSAMDLLTKPLLHFTPSVLRLLQQAAQQVLYLSLCEGTTGVQAVSSGVRQPADLGGGSPSLCSSSFERLSPSLLRRCLAWPGQPTTYPVLLRAVEIAAYETLREPAAVVDIFHNIARLHNASQALALTEDGEARTEGAAHVSSAAMLLSFYLKSPSLRRTSPVNEQVCLGALLACAATAAAAVTKHEDGIPPLPQDLITLLSAFPRVLSHQLFIQWQQRTLTVEQDAVCRLWMFVLLWGGTQTSAPTGNVAAPTAFRSALQVYSRQAPAPFPLPLRRAALQWLVLTQGTILPPSASSPSPHGAEDSAAAAAAAHTAECELNSERLVALLDAASDFFADLVKGPSVSWETPQAASERQLAILAAPRPHRSADERSAKEQQKAEAALAVRTAVLCCMTQHAAQQLLLQYPAAGTSNATSPQAQQQSDPSTLRFPVSPGDVELEALIEVLPTQAQDSVQARFNSNVKALDGSVLATQPVPSAGGKQCREAWVVSLASWIDDFATQTQSSETSPTFIPPPPPSLAMFSSDSTSATWKDVYAFINAAIDERSQRSERSYDCHTTARQRVALLRSVMKRLVRDGATLHASGQTYAAGEVSACVNALLLFTCVYMPLASPACPCPSQGIALLRHELLALLYVFHPQPPARGASSSISLTIFGWLVQQHVRPLFTLTVSLQPSVSNPWANTQPDSSVQTSPSSAMATVEAFAVGELILHHLSATVCVLCAGNASTVGVLNSLYESARILFQQSSQDLCERLDIFCVARSSSAPLLRCAARAWMQVGVLLGEPRTLLQSGQRLAARLVRRQQERDAARWIGKIGSETGIGISCMGEAKAVGGWLEVVPVAAAVCVSVRNLDARCERVDETLTTLLAALPLLRLNDPSASPEDYASLIRRWQEKIQQYIPTPERKRRAVAAQSSASPPTPLALWHQSYVTHLLHAQPFSVIFGHPPAVSNHAEDVDGIKSSDRTAKFAERLRSRVADHLAGPPAAYPPLRPSPSPNFFLQQSSQAAAAETPLTSENLQAAMRCVATATTEDMKAFVQLESTKRHSTRAVKKHSPIPTSESSSEKLKRGQAVQRAWHLIEHAALHRRQLLGSRGGVSDAPPLIPLAEWTSVFLSRSVAAVPHTIHFIRPAVSEVIILESCSSWADAVAVLQHSLSTLQHTGATPVQQYMAQLLLQRLRTTSNLSGPTEAGSGSTYVASSFGARLGGFVYTVPTAPAYCYANNDEVCMDSWRLWKRHLGGYAAHGAPALACHLIDLLLDSYRCHTPLLPPSSTSTPIAQHTLVEALRCSVYDATVTRALFRLFWAQRYRRVEGAHAFLSALRAAKIVHDESLALQAVLTYLWVTTPGAAQQRTALWRAQVLPLLDQQRDALPVMHALAATAEEVQATTYHFYPLSVEAHRAVWKSWTALCRMAIVSEAVALGVVDAFKALHRLSEVEELMVTTCYTLKK